MNRFRRKSHQEKFFIEFFIEKCNPVSAPILPFVSRLRISLAGGNRVEFPSGKQISKTYLPQNRVLLLMCVAAQGFGNGAVCILRGLRVFLGYITLGSGRDK